MCAHVALALTARSGPAMAATHPSLSGPYLEPQLGPRPDSDSDSDSDGPVSSSSRPATSHPAGSQVIHSGHFMVSSPHSDLVPRRRHQWSKPEPPCLPSIDPTLTRLFECMSLAYSSRMVEIQSQMTERAVELLGLAEDRPCFLLDVGCGSCLSGDYLSEEGHCWVGLDISSAMLDVALEREVEGDLMLADMGQGIPFRPGMFDGCIR